MSYLSASRTASASIKLQRHKRPPGSGGSYTSLFSRSGLGGANPTTNASGKAGVPPLWVHLKVDSARAIVDRLLVPICICFILVVFLSSSFGRGLFGSGGESGFGGLRTGVLPAFDLPAEMMEKSGLAQQQEGAKSGKPKAKGFYLNLAEPPLRERVDGYIESLYNNVQKGQRDWLDEQGLEIKSGRIVSVPPAEMDDAEEEGGEAVVDLSLPTEEQAAAEEEDKRLAAEALGKLEEV